MESSVKLFDVSFMISAFPRILAALPVTLELTVVSAFFGLLLGIGQILDHIMQFINFHNVRRDKCMDSLHTSAHAFYQTIYRFCNINDQKIYTKRCQNCTSHYSCQYDLVYTISQTIYGFFCDKST